MDQAKTCHGSRTLQEEVNRMRETGNIKYLTNLASKIIAAGSTMELTFDKFGNYFMQTLLSGLSQSWLNKFIEVYTEDSTVFVGLATHSFGSHVVQLLISLSSHNKAGSMRLVECLCKNIILLGTDFLGSICLLHAMESLPTSSRLVAAVAPHTKHLALTRHGHTVIIKALERGCSQTLGVMESELAGNLEAMVASEYGFRVLSRALELEKEGKVSPKYSRVALFVRNIQFKFSFIRLINFLMINFLNHPAIQSTLLPQVIAVVHKEAINV